MPTVGASAYGAGVRFDQPPVVSARVERPLPQDAWPMTVPAVAQLARDGLDLGPGVTFLVGENGSGKSTIVEAVAEAFGLPPEGGSTQGGRGTWPSESPLGRSLLLQRGIGASRWGFFLRAETMHGWYTFSEETYREAAKVGGGGRRPPRYHEMSHGESFLTVVRSRIDGSGFYCLDEPEAALSFTSTLALMSHLAELVEGGAQVLCATHSPVLAALPGARLLEAGPWGLREARWDELDLVQHWREFLRRPRTHLEAVLG